MKPVRTRIAPSPTGQDLHIGNAYTALINYVFARKNRGKFIIRIEDTDRTRFVEGSEQRILASLKWLGIPHDEGPDIGGPHKPYRQSDRLSLYKKYADELVEKRHAYYCFCTSERLAKMRTEQEANHLPPMYDGLCKKIDRTEAKKRVESGEKFVIRLNVPETGTTSFHDIIRGDISFENKLIDDQVLLKSDGFPTYHLGVVVDDHEMKISHIIRGEEWISSTPKHILLYQFFGWDLPQFAHMPLLRNRDSSKLSKRKNPVWASWYEEQGFFPEAILNYLATMAWAYPDGRELFSIDEMVDVFTLEAIQTTAPIFNTEKLRWMNGEYIRLLSDKELIKKIYEHDAQVPHDDELMERVMPLVKPRMKTLNEFWWLAKFFFNRTGLHPMTKEDKQVIVNALRSVGEDWIHDSLEKAIRAECEKAGKKAKDIFMELRVVVTGETVGPPLLESLEILGKEETLTRLSP